MSGVIKGIGKVAKFASPFLSFIPGVGPIAAAGAGAVGGLLDKGPAFDAQTQQQATTQTGIDPFVDPFRQDFLRRASEFSARPYTPFDPSSVNRFLNPFQSQVESATVADFNRQRGQVSEAAADQATRAGAFGGSRQAVLEAQGLGEVSRNEASALANLRYSGFQDAMGRAAAEHERSQAFPFQQFAMFGDILRGLPQTQSVATTQTGTSRTPPPSAFNRALGGAITGLSFYDLLRKQSGGSAKLGRASGSLPFGGFREPARSGLPFGGFGGY